jgi:hypothetical protein
MAASALKSVDFDVSSMASTSLSTTVSVPGAINTGRLLPPFRELLQYIPAVSAIQEAPSRETDLYAWLLHQANELRSRKPDFIDWSELAEELDEIVALARKETVSRLRTLLAHLLKWKYQTEARDERS